MKTAAPNLLAAFTAMVALSAGLVLTAGDPAVFDTRQAAIMAFDDVAPAPQADAIARDAVAVPVKVKAVAPTAATVSSGIRS